MPEVGLFEGPRRSVAYRITGLEPIPRVELKPGMTPEDAEDLLGPPLEKDDLTKRDEPYREPVEPERWLYRYADGTRITFVEESNPPFQALRPTMKATEVDLAGRKAAG